MELAYLNGERVYIERRFPLERDSEWEGKDGDYKLQVVRHNEVIKALNRLFEYADENPNENTDNLLGIYGLVSEMCRYKKKFRPPIEILDIKSTYFDDPKMVKMAKRKKQEELKQDPKLIIHYGIKSVKNKPRTDNGPVTTADQALSKEYIEFIKKGKGRHKK